MKKLGIFVLAGVLVTLMSACEQDRTQPRTTNDAVRPADTAAPRPAPAPGQQAPLHNTDTTAP